MSISASYALLGDTNLLTVDKFGPQATTLTGQIDSIGGVPVIVRQHMREDLPALGVYEAGRTGAEESEVARSSVLGASSEAGPLTHKGNGDLCAVGVNDGGQGPSTP